MFVMLAESNSWNWLAVLGYDITNTLSLLIYNKAMKHPLLTEKRYTISDIINYTQVDAAMVVDKIQKINIVI